MWTCFCCDGQNLSELFWEDIIILPSVRHQCRCIENSHLRISRIQRLVVGLSFSCRKLANVWVKVHQNCKGSQIDTPVAMYVDYTHLPAFEFVMYFHQFWNINIWHTLTCLWVQMAGLDVSDIFVYIMI